MPVTALSLPRLFLLAALLALGSCAGNQVDDKVVYAGGGEEAPAAPAAAEESLYSTDPFVRQRILADMLYEARLAYEDNRLLSPSGNNAYDMFNAVLDFDPDNEVARQGIHDIVLRYVELADAATGLGQFDNAESYLGRAARIDGDEPAILEARRRLEQARDIKMDVFPLAAGELDRRSLEIMVELGEIGQYIREKEATFLIIARSDEEGRWIYQVMRQAVGGYRLRGNIAVDAEPSIQVVVPQS